MKNPLVLGIIPARFASTRFPGKLLSPILEKPLLQHTYENAKKCAMLDEILIATDDERIATFARSLNAPVVMTPSSCSTGTDRIASVIENHKAYTDFSIIVNIQGDEPCLHPQTIDSTIQALLQNASAQMSTPIVPCSCLEEIQDPSVVKCVINRSGQALYFSRAPIPYLREKHIETQYYRHLGLYCYQKDFVLEYTKLKETPMQLAESLEQLKVLEHGYTIQTCVVHDSSIGVDTPEDVQKIETILCKQNLSSSPEA